MEKNDELFQEIALSLNDNPNIYPEDYQIDHKDDEAIKELLKNNNQGPAISLKKEMEVNSHPDNLNLLSQKENETLKVDEKYIKFIIDEYNNLQRKLFQLKEQNANLGIKPEKFIFPKKGSITVNLNDEMLINQILPFVSNDYCIEQIRKINKHVFLKTKDSNRISYLTEWLYTFLVLLKRPLVDDQNSILYEINKQIIIKQLQNDTYLKIIYIIISKIFNQKILIN